MLQKQAYDRTVDWWCLGSVLYEMLYGLVSTSATLTSAGLLLVLIVCHLQPPFYSRNTAEMYNNILHKSPVLKPNVSNAGRDLLEGLLQKDRTKRLGVKDDFVSLLSSFSIYDKDGSLESLLMFVFPPLAGT